MDQIALDEGWKEQVYSTVCIFGACQNSLSPSPSLALMDVHCSALKQMVEALGRGSSENEGSKIIISDISIQPLVQASMSTSKSIQANLDPSSHSLSFSSLFLFKSLGSLLRIISNNLQCVEHTRNIKTIV